MDKEISRAERAREDRLQERPKLQPKPKPSENDFDRALRNSQLSSQLNPQTKAQSKAATEQAVREVLKHQERRDQDRRRDDSERDEGRDSRSKDKHSQAKVAGQKVIAKGTLKQGSGGAGGGRGGFGQALGRKSMARMLTKAGARSIPVDLQAKFAARLAQAMKGATAAEQAALSQKILNLLVQYVRVGINREGEKEVQVDLHERIFRGLKLRVIARNGKVAVHFRTSDAQGRQALESNTSAIRDALSKKGIEVDEIVVS
jgi:hypothetical protein